MTLRTLIIDDEPLAHDVILTFAKEVPFITVAGQCYSATEALTVLNEQSVDLIFLDIQMPLMTGIELLKVLPNKPLVIITSAYEEFALQGYELDVTDYLLKPFRYDRFLQAVSKALTRHNSSKTAAPTPPQEAAEKGQTHILIKVDKKRVRVALSEISHLEAYGNYVKVHRGQSCLLTPRTLTSLAEQLPQTDFIRVHKSVVVNKAYTDYIEGDTLYLKSGQGIAIGKQHKLSLKNALG
jgi:DNA-binding LytR/AlgR family response regulator